MLGRLAFVLALGLQACNCGPVKPTTDSGTPTPLDLGETVAVLQATMPASGSVITAPEGLVAGLEVRVPAGAWPTAASLTVRATPVNAVHLDGVRAGSALVSFETDATALAEEPLEIFVPGTGTADEFAMVFGYDRATGEFEGMPSYPSEGGTTFFTRHFSEYLTLLTLKVKLDEPMATAFVYGTDDFPMVNDGSFVAPGGFCSGQAVSALHYWQERRRDGGVPLVEYADQRPPGRTASTRETQAFFWDDRRAWRVTSAVQTRSLYTAERRSWWRVNDRQYTNPSLTHQLLTAALYVSKSPQYLNIQRDQGDGGVAGHALIAFGKENAPGGMQFLISDPNYPWREDSTEPRRLTWLNADAGFVPYQGRLNATDPTRAFPRIAYLGTWAYLPREQVRELWAKAQAGELDDVFPGANLVALAGTPGNPERDLVDGLVSTDSTLRVALNPKSFPWSLTVYDPQFTSLAWASDVLDEDSADVVLSPGDNVLGVLVKGRPTGGREAFVDFRWVTVRYTPPQPGEPVLLGSVTFTSPARYVEVVGTTAYVMLDAQGLSLVDVSRSNAPAIQVVADVAPHSTGRGVVVTPEQFAFAGVGSFKLIDVRNPLSPEVLSAVGFNADCGKLVTRGTWAFVACGRKSYVSEGLLGIATIADPTNTTLSRGISGITWSSTVKDVALSASGTTAFLLGSAGTVASFDVSDPASPGLTPVHVLAGTSGTSFALDLEGTRLYVGASALSIVDVSNPAALVKLGGDRYRDVRDLDAVGSTLVAVGVVGDAGRVWFYDVSNPASPTVTKTLELVSPATGVKVVGNRAYVTTATASGAGKLLIIGF
ncbi:MAG: hypothetical protein Q8L48_14165 [Archangium sp.]|nr:hypothetical protein [Archangium sp.]